LKRLQDTTLAYDQQVKRLVEADKATSDALKPLGAMSDKYAETFNRHVRAPRPVRWRLPIARGGGLAHGGGSAQWHDDVSSDAAALYRGAERGQQEGAAGHHRCVSGGHEQGAQRLPAALSSQLEEAQAGMRRYREVLVEVAALFEQKQSLRQQVDQQSQAMDSIMTGLMDTQQRLARDDQHRAFIQIAVLTVLALVVGLLAAVLISRQITGPLALTVELARRIAKGDLTVQAKSSRKDELGDLQNAMQDMAQSLNTLVQGSVMA
jgi:methyl-accepting chemotaxis protein